MTWADFWEKVAPSWLTAIGTVGTVITAIWLAGRNDGIRLRVRGDVRLRARRGEKPPFPRDLMIEVVNLGHRPAQVIVIGWRTGALWFKKHTVQNLNQRAAVGANNKLPVVLKDGDSVKFFFVPHVWMSKDAPKLIGPWARWTWLAKWWLRATATTSTGNIYSGRIGHSFAKEVHEYYMRTKQGRPVPNDEPQSKQPHK